MHIPYASFRRSNELKSIYQLANQDKVVPLYCDELCVHTCNVISIYDSIMVLKNDKKKILSYSGYNGMTCLYVSMYEEEEGGAGGEGGKKKYGVGL